MGRIAYNLYRVIFDQGFRFHAFRRLGFYNRMSDKKFLERLFYADMKSRLDWDNLNTFNEKLQWLKIHDRREEYSQMVDKADAKEYVVERVSGIKIIPTLGVWDSFDEIGFESLPKQFVLKCTHDSGSVVICADKSQFDVAAARKKLSSALKRNYFWLGREWPYKNLKPRIMAEQYMCDSEEDRGNLTDYKIFCFDGQPQYIMTVRDRSKGKGKSLHRWYNLDWELQDLDLDYRNEEREPEPQPEQLQQMLEIAKKLSKGIKHLRVDLYVINGQIFFGELTFYHMSGCERFEPVEWDKKLGDLIHMEDS